MSNLEKDEAGELKEMVRKLNLQACHQILFGMVDLLVYRPSILSKIFRMFIEDGVKFSDVKEKK